MKKRYLETKEQFLNNKNEQNAHDFLQLAIVCMSEIDEEVRDEWALEDLYEYLLPEYISEAELERMFISLIKANVLNGQPFPEEYPSLVGEKTTDHLLVQRSFVPLMFVLFIQHYHRGVIKKLPQEIVEELFQQTIYFGEHIDTTIGYSAELGWIHMYAHYSDMCDELFHVEQIKMQQKLLIVSTMIDMVKMSQHAFNARESDRIARSLTTAIVNGIIDVNQIFEQLTSATLDATLYDYPQYGLENLINTTRAFAVHLAFSKRDANSELLEFEKKTNRFFQ